MREFLVTVLLCVGIYVIGTGYVNLLGAMACKRKGTGHENAGKSDGSNQAGLSDVFLYGFMVVISAWGVDSFFWKLNDGTARQMLITCVAMLAVFWVAGVAVDFKGYFRKLALPVKQVMSCAQVCDRRDALCTLFAFLASVAVIGGCIVLALSTQAEGRFDDAQTLLRGIQVANDGVYETSVNILTGHEPEEAVPTDYANCLGLLAGALARVSGLSVYCVCYHVVTFLVILLVFMACYKAVGIFFERRWQQFLALFLLAVLSLYCNFTDGPGYSLWNALYMRAWSDTVASVGIMVPVAFWLAFAKQGRIEKCVSLALVQLAACLMTPVAGVLCLVMIVMSLCAELICARSGRKVAPGVQMTGGAMAGEEQVTGGVMAAALPALVAVVIFFAVFVIQRMAGIGDLSSTTPFWSGYVDYLVSFRKMYFTTRPYLVVVAAFFLYVWPTDTGVRARAAFCGTIGMGVFAVANPLVYRYLEVMCPGLKLYVGYALLPVFNVVFVYDVIKLVTAQKIMVRKAVVAVFAVAMILFSSAAYGSDFKVTAVDNEYRLDGKTAAVYGYVVMNNLGTRFILPKELTTQLRLYSNVLETFYYGDNQYPMWDDEILYDSIYGEFLNVQQLINEGMHCGYQVVVLPEDMADPSIEDMYEKIVYCGNVEGYEVFRLVY